MYTKELIVNHPRPIQRMGRPPLPRLIIFGQFYLCSSTKLFEKLKALLSHSSIGIGHGSSLAAISLI
jgi:hypothetical protein